MLRPALRVSVLWLAVALYGCASAAGGSSAACRSELAPDARSLSEIVDSVALQELVSNTWDPRNGLVLASVNPYITLMRLFGKDSLIRSIRRLVGAAPAIVTSLI